MIIGLIVHVEGIKNLTHRKGAVAACHLFLPGKNRITTITPNTVTLKRIKLIATLDTVEISCCAVTGGNGRYWRRGNWNWFIVDWNWPGGWLVKILVGRCAQPHLQQIEKPLSIF